VEFRCRPFSWEGSPEQTLHLIFNGVDVGAISLERDMKVYRSEVPAQLVRPGLNHLLLRAGHARAPAAVGLGDDRRELAIAFDTVSLLRR
jgi:hypothetical protein